MVCVALCGCEPEATFVHIPRTGGIALLGNHSRRFPFVHIWHSNRALPPLCYVYTLLRNETERYCSEWRFYGTRFFMRNQTVKGWKPTRAGFPTSFEEFARDPSTHNTITKILSGCQLYSADCTVDETTVMDVVHRVRSGCIRVLARDASHAHVLNESCTETQLRTAHRVNWLDRELLMNLWK